MEACGTQWRAEERGRERQWEDGRAGKCTHHLKLLKEGRGGNTLFEPHEQLPRARVCHGHMFEKPASLSSCL